MRRVLSGLALAALLAAAPAARADDGSLLANFADTAALTWVAQQKADGTFADPVTRKGGYGSVMIGYALLRAGVRRGDPSAVAAGIRALNSYLSNIDGVRSYFLMLAVAKSYVFATTTIPGNRLFQRSRAGWAHYLESFHRGPSEGSAAVCIASPDCFHNHEAVRMAAQGALLQTGLSSTDPRSPLHNRSRLQQLLGEEADTIGGFVGRNGTLTGADNFGAIGLLSDSGGWPLAYHGLASAMYAIGIEQLLPSQTGPALTALRRAARASLGLMAPDGDVTWLGRHQQEAWALASEIVLGASAAELLDIPTTERRQLRAMALTGFDRLLSKHPITPDGLANTPPPASAVGAGQLRDIEGDPVNANGLAMFLLDLAADRIHAHTASTIPMDHNARFVVPDQAAFTAVRHGATWYALRRVGSHSDLRYDFGLLALKVLRADGWHDLVGPRPVVNFIATPDVIQGGPVIVRRGTVFRPSGLLFQRNPRGGTTILTSYQHPDLPSFTVPISYQPTRDGLVITLTVEPGDSVQLTSFEPTEELTRLADGVADASARFEISGLLAVTERTGMISCCQPDLAAVTLNAAPDGAGKVVYAISAAA